MPPDVQIYGALIFRAAPDEITSRPRGLDHLVQVCQTDSPDTFLNGGAPEGYPNMRIRECKTKEEIAGSAYEHRLECEGLLSSADKTESNRIRTPQEGWDEGPMDILTLRPDLYEIGRAHPTIATLFAVDIDKDQVTENLWRISAGFKGIVPQINGLPKGRKRRITTNNQSFSSSSLISLNQYVGGGGSGTLTPFRDENNVFTGWETTEYAKMDSSRVVVVDTFLTTTAPPTDGMPGHLTPDNAPAVFDIFNLPWYSPSGWNLNWPWGWTLRGIQSEPLIHGIDIYLTSITTEYVPKRELK